MNAAVAVTDDAATEAAKATLAATSAVVRVGIVSPYIYTL